MTERENNPIDRHLRHICDEFDVQDAVMVGEPVGRLDGGYVAAYHLPKTEEIVVVMEAEDGDISTRFEKIEILGIGNNDFMRGIVTVISMYRAASTSEEMWDRSLSHTD